MRAGHNIKEAEGSDVDRAMETDRNSWGILLATNRRFQLRIKLQEAADNTSPDRTTRSGWLTC